MANKLQKKGINPEIKTLKKSIQDLGINNKRFYLLPLMFLG